MATELVDVRHPDVGISRVRKGTLHLFERSGWEQVSPKEAAKFHKELDELDQAFATAGVFKAKERRAAREALIEAAKQAPATDEAATAEDAPVSDEADTADTAEAEKPTTTRRRRGAETKEG